MYTKTKIKLNNQQTPDVSNKKLVIELLLVLHKWPLYSCVERR